MCGIAGILHLGPTACSNDLKRGISKLASRGPDGEGMAALKAGRMIQLHHEELAQASLMLGHRRLAILDQSACGHQPMIDPDTGNAIVFNGEIYNFLELREELLRENPSLHFESDSDTEVLLKGWQMWGEDLFPRMNGMWALLLYDTTRRELIASRDRMGVKPLYVYCSDTEILFASEIPSLLTMGHLRPEPDRETIFDYLLTGIVDHRPERTFYQGIQSVAPGEFWRIDPALHVQRVRYHRFDVELDESLFSTPAELLSLLESSTALRLRSDAPTVSLLSGGLDSPLITTLASRHGNDRRTRFAGAYTYAYTGDENTPYDESKRAALIASTVFPHCPHHIFRTSPRLETDDLDRFFRAQAEPTTTPSLLAGLRIYRRIREEGIRVVLSSEGADELFGGYPRAYLSRALVDSLLSARALSAFHLLRFHQTSLRDIFGRLTWHLPSPVTKAMLRRLRRNVQCISPALWHEMQPRLLAWKAERSQPLQARLRQDVLSTLLPHVLRCADRNSMANSVEVRTPFLDYRVVQFALRQPASRKVGPTGTKLILRQAARQIMPDEFVSPPKVLGFGHAEQHQLGNLQNEWQTHYDTATSRQYITLPDGPTDQSSLEIWWPYSVARWLNTMYT